MKENNLGSRITYAMQMGVREDIEAVAKLKRILTENGYKHTQVASRIMLSQAQEFIGNEAYMYWSMVALNLED